MFRSNAWLSSIYPVENLVETTLARKPDYFPGEVRQARMRFREGRRVRDWSITFDHAGSADRYKDHLSGEEAQAAIQPGTADAMTSFYHARHLPVAPGDTVSLPVMDGREPYLLEVKVLRTELWITNDQRRIPVKLRTKVTVGSVTATTKRGIFTGW